MLAVNRFRVVDEEAFRARLEAAVEVLRGQAGFVAADHGRNLDEPDLWVLVTTWRDVGSYRRALGAYDVKVSVWPLLNEAVQEAGAFADPAEH